MSKKILSVLCIFVIAISLFSINVSANQYVYVTGDALNIRNAPSTDSPIMGQALYGDSLIVYGKEGNWYLIYYWGVMGYVSGDYVSNYHPDNKPTTGQRVVDYAKTFTGIPYVYGGNSPSQGFDCSGFVYFLYKEMGVTLNRVAAGQMTNGKWVSLDDIQPGDIAGFKNSSGYVNHVGIYVGNGMMIHAPQTGDVVKYTSIVEGNYAGRIAGVRRIFD